MVVPHPGLPFEHRYNPWPEPASYPYMLGQDTAVLAVVSAGCLYLVHVACKQTASGASVSHGDVRDAVSKRLDIPAVRLWRLTSPWCLPNGVSRKVQVDALSVEDNQLAVDGQRFLLLAAPDAGSDQEPPEELSRERFNELVSRRRVTLARAKHACCLFAYTVFCVPPMTLCGLAVGLVFALCYFFTLPLQCWSYAKERRRHRNVNEIC
eukprot:TRINITY_DN18916_c0_g1_i1.p1 TRINITY_DN18916_c0_g1~~TRINITY_DN18916_c0_g1_i1.p1  ORF type:complete len:244 (-),score=23.70 TRINITY_DN18916_c0_g1_i1:196-822(-)